MEKDYFLNSNIPQSQNLDHQMPWNNSYSASQELTSSAQQQQQQQPMDFFMNSTWNDSMNNINQFDSSLTTTSPPSSNGFIFREFIGRLGSVSHSNELTEQQTHQIMNTQLNSENSVGLRNPTLPSLVSDPGFAERAAKFSCFGSRSFNGRSSQLGCNKNELNYRSSVPLAKLPRVCSSPSLKQGGLLPETKNSFGLGLNSDQSLRRFTNSVANSNENENENSSVSEQGVSGETGSKTPCELNSRKRKAVSRGKLKEISEPSNVANVEENVNAKRLKQGKREEEAKGTNSNNEEEKQNQEKGNQKPPEPPKDYIHVRARRGQATDSHSLAERVRREKISERMKLLQDLVPGCNKVTGKSLMLVEIINYVQALQRQVEFLSMKLSSVNSRMDYEAENPVSKDMYQPNTYLPQPVYPLDFSALSAFYGHHPQQVPRQQINHNTSSNVSADSLNGNTLNHCIGMQLPPVGGVVEGLPQFSALCEDDLQSIVQMGFNQNSKRERPFHSEGLLAPIQDSDTKIEL